MPISLSSIRPQLIRLGALTVRTIAEEAKKDDINCAPFAGDVFEKERQCRQIGFRISDTLWRAAGAQAKSTGSYEDQVAQFYARFSDESKHIKERQSEEMMRVSEFEAQLSRRLARNKKDKRAKAQLLQARQAIERSQAKLQEFARSSAFEVQTLGHIHTQSHEQVMQTLRQMSYGQ